MKFACCTVAVVCLNFVANLDGTASVHKDRQDLYPKGLYSLFESRLLRNLDPFVVSIRLSHSVQYPSLNSYSAVFVYYSPHKLPQDNARH